MEFPKTINVYCPKCGRYTEHVAKLHKKGKMATLRKGQRRHSRKLTGYFGKVAGTKPKRKQADHKKVMLACKECNYKVERVVHSRIKRLEIAKH